MSSTAQVRASARPGQAIGTAHGRVASTIQDRAPGRGTLHRPMSGHPAHTAQVRAQDRHSQHGTGGHEVTTRVAQPSD